ncbi:Rha family transcriptional regulator [Microcoleus sp. T3B2]|uniref:Rha family transcriptional regulator n=1 Tax=Microcoleus sp. T3B2 TaxID=3055426 RepID=UPI002FCEEA3F
MDIISHQGELVVDSRLIALRLGIQHEVFMRTLKKYQPLIEQRFGIIRFENGEIKGRGQREKYALLTEPQATTLMTFSRNTAQVVECKLALVEAFEKAKQVIQTVIPQQSNRIKELELEVELARQLNRGRELDSSLVTLHGSAVALALRGVGGVVVEVEKPTIEVIGERVSFKGQTLTQVVDHLKKRHGIRNFKSGADLKRFLERLEKDGLIAQTPRSVLQDYVPAENEQEVYQTVINCVDRQLPMGYQFDS